jgi:hypothetical protein
MKQKFAIHTLLMFLLSIVLGQGPVYSEDLEGSAAVALQGDLPESGFVAASNSFSRNTTVNVTNLESGKTTQVVVIKGLDINSYGILLTLSRDAANAIGIYSRDIVRVRVTLPSDSAAFSRFNDGRSFSGDPDYDPRAFVRSNALPLSGTTLSEGQGTGTAYNETVQPFHTYTPIPNNSGSASSSLTVTTMPLSDALSLQSGQYVPPNVVSVPPSPVDPVIIVMPAAPEGLSTQGSGSALTYGTSPSSLSEPPVSTRVLSTPVTRATATGPYKDPGETEIILRSPDLVINAPLPEMAPVSGTATVTAVESAPPSASPPIDMVNDRTEVSSAPQVFYIRDPDDIKPELPSPPLYPAIDEELPPGRANALAYEVEKAQAAEQPVTRDSPDIFVVSPMPVEGDTSGGTAEPVYDMPTPVAPSGGGAFAYGAEETQAAPPPVTRDNPDTFAFSPMPVEGDTRGDAAEPSYDVSAPAAPDIGSAFTYGEEQAQAAEPLVESVVERALLPPQEPSETDSIMTVDEPAYTVPVQSMAYPGIPIETAQASDITEEYPTAYSSSIDPMETSHSMDIDEPAYTVPVQSVAYPGTLVETTQTGDGADGTLLTDEGTPLAGTASLFGEAASPETSPGSFMDEMGLGIDLAADEPGYGVDGGAGYAYSGEEDPVETPSGSIADEAALADALSLFGEPVESGDTVLGEPGYGVDGGAGYAYSGEEDPVETPSGSIADEAELADALSLFGEPVESGDAILGEPSYGVGGGEQLPFEDVPALDREPADFELSIFGEPLYSNDADVTVLPEEPAPVGDTGLMEPGYAVGGGAGYAYSGEEDSVETSSGSFADETGLSPDFAADEPGYGVDGGTAYAYSGEEDSVETSSGSFVDEAELSSVLTANEPGLTDDIFGVGDGEPLPFGDVSDLDREPAELESLLFGEPLYSDDIETATLLGEPVYMGDIGLAEPAYRMLEDGTIVDAEGIPVTDEAAVLLGEPVGQGDTGLIDTADTILSDREPADFELSIFGEPLYSNDADVTVLPEEPVPVGDTGLTEPGDALIDTADAILSDREPADFELSIFGEPLYSNDADVTVLPEEPVPVGDTDLTEPAYRMLEDGTIVDAEGIPVTDEAALAEAAVLLGEPVGTGDTGLSEPEYRVTENVVDTDANKYTGIGGGEDFDTTALVEPGYTIAKDEQTKPDRADSSFSNDPTDDTVIQKLNVPGVVITEFTEYQFNDAAVAEEADSGLIDPVERDEGFVFIEPGYTIQTDSADAGMAVVEGGDSLVEIEPTEPGYRMIERDTPDAAAVAVKTGTPNREWILNEPGYTRQEADATTVGGSEQQENLPEQASTITDEPGYFMTEETIQGEPVSGTGNEDEFQDTAPLATVAQPDNPEYFPGLLPPKERTDFSVNEPAVNIIENARMNEREEESAPSAFSPEAEIESKIPFATSVKTVDGLEAGKYYVQIGGYSNIERIEAIMGELDSVYPLVLMGNRYILIGPLNEGESNALEQRFRVGGFANAFVVMEKGHR